MLSDSTPDDQETHASKNAAPHDPVSRGTARSRRLSESQPQATPNVCGEERKGTTGRQQRTI
jgi:hypothetical protein